MIATVTTESAEYCSDDGYNFLSLITITAQYCTPIRRSCQMLLLSFTNSATDSYRRNTLPYWASKCYCEKAHEEQHSVHQKSKSTEKRSYVCLALDNGICVNYRDLIDTNDTTTSSPLVIPTYARTQLNLSEI